MKVLSTGDLEVGFMSRIKESTKTARAENYSADSTAVTTGNSTSTREISSITSVSSSESKMISALERENILVFGVEEATRITGWNRRKVYNTLYSLEKKNRVTRIKRNKYVLSEYLPERLFEVSTEALKPSYISFWTALSHYGFTEQGIKSVQLVSTRQVEEFKFNSHKVEITTFNRNRFYGYRKESRIDSNEAAETGFTVAEPEKAIIDSLYLPEKAGGLEEVVKCLKNSWEDLNKNRFIKYLLNFNNKSLVSRSGYLIEELGLKMKNSGIEKLEKNRSSTYVELQPGKKSKREKEEKEHNSKWRITKHKETKIQPNLV